MNNMEKICESIIDNANIEKEKIISFANSTTNKKINDFKTNLENQQKQDLEKIEIECKEKIERSKNKAKLETTKQQLGEKHKVLDEIFSKVVEDLCNLEIEDYKKLINNLLVEYAQVGDGISLSTDTKVDEDFIKSLEIYKERDLRFLYHKTNIKGGFVLVNEDCDTIVSFEDLAEELRDKYEYKIIKDIFGE